MHSPLLKMSMENKTTSKTSSLKALLLRAWRERWSDLQWGINIKTILPRGVSGDVYNLADCILQQAVVGSGANQLVLSYLKHSLSAQVVSYAAVLQRISKFDQFQKSHCILSLLEFLENIYAGVTCRSKPEETLLAPAILSIINWLLSVFHNSLCKQPTGTPIINDTDLLEKSGSILNAIVDCEFMMAMCCLAKYNDIELYNETTKRCYEIDSLLKSGAGTTGTGSTATKSPVMMVVEQSIEDLLNLDVDTVSKTIESVERVTYCIQGLLEVNVIHDPSAATGVLVSQMLLIKRTKGFTMARLYCEILRACWLSLHEVSGTVFESQWGAFIFLKIPHVLSHLHSITKGPSDDNTNDYSQDVVDGIELFMEHVPLLNNLDVKCSCNCLECMLGELAKLNLVTEKHIRYLLQKREQTSANITLGLAGTSSNQNKTTKEPSGTIPPGIPKVVIQAEPTFAGILKTLQNDKQNDKLQEPLLRMLYQVLNGKSFELILSVASVEGKLRPFVLRLLKFNECSKNATVEQGKTAAMLFDSSFIMLCAIVQTYGSEVVLEENGDTFFEQWVRQCMVERGKPKSPEQILSLCDQQKVDILLQQLNANDGTYGSGSMNVKWHEICENVPGAMKEILYAWEQGALSANDVKRILDVLRERMCSMAIVATAWLCSYMQIVQQDTLLKPANMVQHFLTPHPTSYDENMDNFIERANLMVDVIRRMQHDVHPPLTAIKPKIGTTLVSRQPVYERLRSVWSVIQKRGWVDHESIIVLRCLLTTSGATWFVLNIVREIMRCRFQDDLDKAVDLASAVFHLDIESCTQALLLSCLPQYLCNSLLASQVVEPQSTALAKLCAYAIFASLEYSHYSPKATVQNGRKRPRSEESEEVEVPAPKLMRMDDTSQPTTQYPPASTSPNNIRTNVCLREPLLSALKGVFRIFNNIANRDGFVSQQTYFMFNFIKLIVSSGKDRSGVVLQALPNSLVPYLLRALPELFTSDLLLKLYDINTTAGRNSIARDLCMLRNFDLRKVK